MPSDRDRLIELILQGENEADKKGIANCQMYNLEKAKILADYLLANGVIVPPVQIGQKVWILYSIEKTIRSKEIASITRRQKSWTMHFTCSDCFTVWDNAEDEYFGKNSIPHQRGSRSKVKGVGIMSEYIEREKLLKDISETVVFTVARGTKLPTLEMRGANKVIDQVKSAPTADVVELRYGRWEVTEHSEHLNVICSNCNEDFYVYKKGQYRIDRSNYCPKCGARMEREGK